MKEEERTEIIKKFIDILDNVNRLQGEMGECKRILINLERSFSSDVEVALRQTIDYYIL